MTPEQHTVVALVAVCTITVYGPDGGILGEGLGRDADTIPVPGEPRAVDTVWPVVLFAGGVPRTFAVYAPDETEPRAAGTCSPPVYPMPTDRRTTITTRLSHPPNPT